MRIIIAGAGIAGLTAALSLEAAGLRDVHIMERAPEIRGLGVGINLLPHAVRELTELGLADRIEQLGTPPASLSYYNRFGQRIWTEARGVAAGYAWPQLSVHRGRLQIELLQAVRERLGDVVHTGHELLHAQDNGSGVTARFAADGEEVDVDGDVLIGADGIRSRLRASQHPTDGEPVWNGLTLWRGVARIPAFLDATSMVMVGDDEQKFVAYPLEAVGADGTQSVNFIAEQRGGGVAESGDWNRSVAAEPIAERFTGWIYNWLDIPSVIRAADDIFEYPMIDRNPLPWWSNDSMTLIGDAAHAMYPNGSNGGSQAILDARALAYRLAAEPTVSSALACYEQDRRPPTTRLLTMTRQTGPERVMALAHDRAPKGFDDIADVIPREELERIASDYKRAAGFDPEQLNQRSTYSVTR